MQTNIYKIIGLPAIFSSLVYMGCYVKSNEFPNLDRPVEVEYFKQGQTLLPSYACPDTLIVNDAKGLNLAMGYIEQGIIDGTDGDIDEILHTYCTNK